MARVAARAKPSYRQNASITAQSCADAGIGQGRIGATMAGPVAQRYAGKAAGGGRSGRKTVEFCRQF
jgi:hypothetical protein